MALKAKQLAFVERYLTHWNATRAAIEAGYSENTARAIGAENLTKPDIKAHIDARLTEIKMSADEVLSRLADMARADIADFVGVRKIADLDKDEYRGKTHVIKKFKSKLTTDHLGRQIEEVELELYPADVNLERIGKHHGIFNTGPDGSEDKPFILKVVYGSDRANGKPTEASPQTD